MAVFGMVVPAMGAERVPAPGGCSPPASNVNVILWSHGHRHRR
jgi:hypothetical protein